MIQRMASVFPGIFLLIIVLSADYRCDNIQRW